MMSILLGLLSIVHSPHLNKLRRQTNSTCAFFSLYLICSISALFFLKWIKSVFIWWATLLRFISRDQHGRLFWSSTHHATIYWWYWYNRLEMKNVSNCFSLSLFSITFYYFSFLLSWFSIHRCLLIRHLQSFVGTYKNRFLVQEYIDSSYDTGKKSENNK